MPVSLSLVCRVGGVSSILGSFLGCLVLSIVMSIGRDFI